MKDTRLLRRAGSPGHWVAVMVLLLVPYSIGAVEIETLLAFATGDGVRIARGRGDFVGVEFRAAITRSSSGQLLWQGLRRPNG